MLIDNSLSNGSTVAPFHKVLHHPVFQTIIRNPSIWVPSKENKPQPRMQLEEHWIIGLEKSRIQKPHPEEQWKPLLWSQITFPWKLVDIGKLQNA